MENNPWIRLNNELINRKDGTVDLEKDKEATKQFFLGYINKNMVWFHSLKEKIDYLIENGYYHNFLENYTIDEIKEVFSYVYGKKFRFSSYMAAFLFYKNYAMKDIEGEKFLERYEDRISSVALFTSINVKTGKGDVTAALRQADIMINQEYQPATPTFSNAGKLKGGQLVSCFLDTLGDSKVGISKALQATLDLSSMGGGVSFNLSKLRGRGESIKGVKGRASGVLPVMKLMEDAFSYADQLGQRQGAGAVYLNIFHSDIEEFLDSKKVNADEKLRIKSLSLGVIIPAKFMELAEKDEPFYAFHAHTVKQEYGIYLDDIDMDTMYNDLLRNPNVTKVKLNARKMLTKIAQIQKESGYPYVFLKSNANEYHPLKNLGDVQFSNLCFSGDTMVAVADGRNAVSIKELAEESKNEIKFPVYSARKSRKNYKQWVTEVKTAVAFQTGWRETIEVFLSNGTSFKCTPEHKIATSDGEYVEAKHSLNIKLVKFFTSSQGKYRGINSYTNGYARQHRMVWEYFNGDKPLEHHIDHIIDEPNDRIENLQLLHRDEHFKKTGKGFEGSGNAMNNCRNKDITVHNIACKSFGSNNPNHSGLTDLELIEIGKKCLELHGEILPRLCKEINSDFPLSFSKNRFGGKRSTFNNIVKGIEEYVAPEEPEQIDNQPLIDKSNFSEVIIVTRIESRDMEAVYDLTVEDNHNFYILTKDIKNDYMESEGVLVHNCTEIMQYCKVSEYNDYDKSELDVVNHGISCNLGSLNIAQVMRNSNKESGRFAKIIDTAMDSLTNVTDRTNIGAVPAIAKANRDFRSVGLGAMNFHGFLAQNNIMYESTEALDFANVFFGMMNYHTLRRSMEICRERGGDAFYGYEGSEYHNGNYFERYINDFNIFPKTDKVKELFEGIEIPTLEDWLQLKSDVMIYGVYNSYRLAIAPNQSTGYIMSATPSIMPISDQVEVREYGHSTTYYPMPGMTEDNMFYFKSAYDMDQFKVLRLVSVIQRHIDQGISCILHTNSADDTALLGRYYIYAHKMGIKSLYYTRTRKSSIDECLSCSA